MNTQLPSPIAASLVADDQRLNFLPKYFGSNLMLSGEGQIFSWMRNLCPGYSGAFWEFYELSNGGFYAAPSLPGPLRIVVEGNGHKGELSADACGIVVTLFALNTLCCALAETGQGDHLADHYYQLREFALQHTERENILAAID
ncbi:antirestriction protein [Shinella yambaruensis]|uniref:Antirestriction protein n=1 Tax=Shinella yambaruensis TaxID=415996 RepID=A0ABQ5ZQQ4_9HYPH|nr:antirestriction protein [Shinella yambaruensis]MCJ8029952.1 antirestriction protein [Shinella yambaruensis]MCU7984207.1 antirestriction protein [Shinella yambaruensis]GLR55199.1 hypothetical protein GCM10007923_64210 [Shinella yambaruensis]